MTKTKVLIVDDEIIGRQLLQAVLLPEGYEIFLAEDGEEAITLTQAHKPHLVLMDVMMPGIDGYETVRRMKAIDEIASIPVIMVTALDDRDSRIIGLEAGAVDYITKPFDRLEIITKIKNRTQIENHESASSEITPKEQKNSKDSYIEQFVKEILTPTEHNLKFSGNIEYALRKEDKMALASSWVYKSNDSEVLCLFGPVTVEENALLGNCLIYHWLCQSNMDDRNDTESLSSCIYSKLKSSDFFDIHTKPWWLVVFMKDPIGNVHASGFNIPFLTYDKVLNGSENVLKKYNTQARDIIDLKTNCILLFGNALNDASTMEDFKNLLKQHFNQPESFTFTSTYESLLKKANKDASFGIKIIF